MQFNPIDPNPALFDLDICSKFWGDFEELLGNHGEILHDVSNSMEF